MKELLLLLIVAFVVFLIALLTLVDGDDTTTVRAASWGSEKPWYVVEPPTTTTTARARTAPMKRTMRSASVAPTASAAEAVAVIRDVFSRFGTAIAEQAVRVSSCETGGTFDPTVVNSSGHTGLFQLAPRYHTARAARLGFSWPQMREARPNALVAADLFAEQHWGPWTCRYAA